MPEPSCLICGQKKTETYSSVGDYSLVKCLNDGIVYVSPRPSFEEYTKFYADKDYYHRLGDARGVTYRNYLEDEYIHSKNFRSVVDKIEKFKSTKGRILDIGCAFGFLVKEAKLRGWEAYGVDFNATAVEYGKKQLRLKNMFAGTVSDCKFPDNYFDAICIIGVVDHFYDPLQELKEVARILKENGIFLITLTDINSLIGRRSLCPPEHLWYFSTDTISMLLRKAGFHPFHCEGWYMAYS